MALGVGGGAVVQVALGDQEVVRIYRGPVLVFGGTAPDGDPETALYDEGRYDIDTYAESTGDDLVTATVESNV